MLLAIDVEGAKTVCHKFPKALKIFIKTPSLKVLKERLMKRNSEKPATIDLRLKRAKKELSEARHYDAVIVNDRLTSALKKLKEIIQEI